MISMMLHDCVLPVGLVFYVDVMSVALNTNNLVSGSPLQIPLAWLFVLKYTRSPTLKVGLSLEVVFEWL